MSMGDWLLFGFAALALWAGIGVAALYLLSLWLSPERGVDERDFYV